jgi:hypothetical protein
MNTTSPSRSADGFQIANALVKVFSVAVVAATLLFPAVAHAQFKLQSDSETLAESQSRFKSNDWPMQETADLIALRGSSSPAERKLSFNLFLLSRQARKAPLGSYASMVDTHEVNPDGTVTVDILAYLSPSLMASPVMADIVRKNGAISPEDYASDHLRVRVTQSQLLELAANPNVLTVHVAAAMATNAQPTATPVGN